MNENLFIFSHCLKFHQIIHDTDTTASTHQQVLAKIPGLLAHRMLQTHFNFSQTNVTSQLRHWPQ